jgi:hypothetical protein
VKRVLWLGLVAAIAAGCGGDDKDDDDSAPRYYKLAHFASPRIAFTFSYPNELMAEKRPREPVLASVGVERGSRLNAIKVRRTARRELEPERYLDEFRRDFERTVGSVEKREMRIGELDTGVLEFEDTVKRGDEKVDFTSSSYFFKGAGETWQVECIADEEHRQQIEEACRTALESVDFAR